MEEFQLGSCLRGRDAQLPAYLSCQEDFYFSVPGNGSKMTVFWIKENRMFGTFAMENAAFSCQMADTSLKYGAS